MSFFLEIRRLGYVEGKNLVIERYSGEGRAETYPKLARDVAASNPDLILAFTNWMVTPVKEATSTIPIVAMTSDPVQAGLVTSMSRPGGNLTGVSVEVGLEIWGKRLELFREIVPTISKLAILGLRQTRWTEPQYRRRLRKQASRSSAPPILRMRAKRNITACSPSCRRKG